MGEGRFRLLGCEGCSLEDWRVSGVLLERGVDLRARSLGSGHVV